ncbi:hypothetical protein BDM02DRAFT_3109317 [Thelephora ganbajun]|uniref:Uncharacterized protein n=1 Tax=Thelephora ganbajun TaxID=370292 RepID=A0ACB6ZT64_THEGA|nr:hypothetical protein BDM02DRAFT_3109317 [Thelephora ganbajun]
MSRACLFEYGNAEAGPSTLVPPLIPYVGSSTSQPSGGTISSTTADAVTTQTTTEEDEVPASKRTRRPYRVSTQKDASKLCDWVQGWKKLPEVPTLNRVLAVAAEVIPTIRPVASLQPCLLIGYGKRTAVGSKKANAEFERRNVERRLLQELSRYYPLGPNQKVRTRLQLLSLGKHDAITRYTSDTPLARTLLGVERFGGSPCSARAI